jgi:hypothetical protein
MIALFTGTRKEEDKDREGTAAELFSGMEEMATRE